MLTDITRVKVKELFTLAEQDIINNLAAQNMFEHIAAAVQLDDVDVTLPTDEQGSRVILRERALQQYLDEVRGKNVPASDSKVREALNSADIQSPEEEKEWQDKLDKEKEIPVEDTPVEEIPVEEVVKSEEIPVEDTPVEEIPVEDEVISEDGLVGVNEPKKRGRPKKDA